MYLCFYNFADSDDSVKDPDYQDNRERAKFTVRLYELNDFSSITDPNFQPSIQCEDRSAIDVNLMHFIENTVNELNVTTNDDTPNANIDLVDPDTTKTASLTPTKKGKKRKKNESNWKKNVAKKLRNCGKPYRSSKTKKEIPARKLKPPCKETCKFHCHSKITETQRQDLLNDYWNLGDVEKQWSFILQSLEEVKPVHRYVRIDENGTPAPKRDNNNA